MDRIFDFTTKWKLLFIVLLVVWLIAVFMFSQQSSTVSKGTSTEFIKDVVIPIVPAPESVTEASWIESLQNIVRKMAHFSLYTLGGMLIYGLMCAFDYYTKKKIIISIIMGASFAVIDELHQAFIPGRSAEIRDVLIDTAGIVLGVMLVCCGIVLVKFVKYKMKSRDKRKVLELE